MAGAKGAVRGADAARAAPCPTRRRRRVGICLTPVWEKAGRERRRWADVPVQFRPLQFTSSRNTRTQPVNRKPAMTADQILAEIREANLSYLMLAQSLIRSDR